jgi:spore maturation protein CgeB
MWIKGLLRLGCDVHRFSYRNILNQLNPISGKYFRRLMPRFAGRTADNVLVEQIRAYSPDIVFILSMKYISNETVSAAREAAPDAVFIGRDDDPFPEKNPHRLSIARKTDIVITTSGGRFLRTYIDTGVPSCAFIPNMCDPDIQYRYEVEDKWRTNIIFTGKAEHRRLGSGAGRNADRYMLVHKLLKMPGVKMYGCFGNPNTEGIDTFRAISGAKIALSINIINDVSLYHSDRLTNYLACGTFVLAKRVPDTDRLFKDGVHLRYFDTVEEFFDLAKWYLAHDNERMKIANAGMERTHREYNCQKISKYMLDVVETGTYNAPWT